MASPTPIQDQFDLLMVALNISPHQLSGDVALQFQSFVSELGKLEITLAVETDRLAAANQENFNLRFNAKILSSNHTQHAAQNDPKPAPDVETAMRATIASHPSPPNSQMAALTLSSGSPSPMSGVSPEMPSSATAPSPAPLGS